MTYLSIYDIPIPSIVEIFNIEITNLVEFNVFDPETLIQGFIDPEFELKDFLFGDTTDKFKDFFGKLEVYIWIIAFTFCMLTIASCLTIFRMCKEKMVKMLKEFLR